MKHELADIYRALSTGALSQQDALTRIRALKRDADASSADAVQAPAETLLAETAWERATATTGAAPVQQRVLLCGLSHADPAQVQAALPAVRCSAIGIPGSATPADAYAVVALAYVDAIRALLQEKPQGRSVVQLAAADREGAQLLAGLAGLIETAALENPDIAGQVLLLPADIGNDALIAHLRADAADPDARVLRYTHGARELRRWRFADESSARTDTLCRFREHGVYLITGGLGGLGQLIAKQILATAAHAKIVLCGRSAPGDDGRAALDAFAAPGRVEYRQADIGDAAQTDALVAGILADHGALHGVIHSAGLLRDEFILKKSAAQFADVLRPKVSGSEHLDRATAALPLDMFLLFSSIAAWTGNVGQADYAAANGFMDQFAGWRNARVAAGERHGLSLAIAWPHWRDGGMNIDATSLRLLEKRTGLRSMDTADGMRALQRSLALGHSHVMAMHGVPADMRRALMPERAAAAASPAAPIPAAAPVAAPTDLIGKTREFLRNEFSTVLKIPTHRIDVKAPLEQYGIDSILAMSLTHQLEASFGALPKTLFFEYLSIDELAAYFVRAHAATLTGMLAVSAPMPSATAAVKPAAARAAPGLPASRRRNRFLAATGDARDAAAPATFAHEAIAIVGLSGRYPESPDLDAFWRNLRDGRDCIVEVPASRWDWKAWYSEDRSVEGAHFSKWGGFIEGADEFDPRFFNIAPREARTIDPQERLFLQHAWMAIEDAGYARAALQVPDAKGLPGQVGVYAGVMYGEYNLSGSLASIANRVSYFLNLHGPSLTLDTMCSSSLTALHLACQDLRLGRTALALAGGVNVSIHPNKYTMLSGGQFISGDGHCQSFGEGGDGYIPGEGVGVAVLKRLSDAERDGNHIYGVIRGSALNHGGKTNGYTVPNPQAQAEVIRRALGEAGIDPRHVSYIEAHGTGTKLGDPIEIAALTRAFHEGSAAHGDDTGYCLIGSAKSNIGHCESAAGIAGVTKVLLQMRHASIVPSLHSKVLNPHIDFATTPFVVVQELRAWARPVRDGRALPRIAGVSSFGAGGANAHIVLEEYVAAERAPVRSDALRLVPLSARNPEQLEARARDLLAFLDREGDAVDARDLAHTLQVGREAMDLRVCFAVDGLPALRGALQTFIAGGSPPSDRIHTGNAKQQRDALVAHAEDPAFQAQLERFIAERALVPLAALWAEGVDIDWRRLNDDAAPRLMSLPTYPFARERYWIAPATVNAPAVAKPSHLHPLVHSNASDLEEQRYLAYLDARQAPLTDGALPPLLALEALRAALALAVPASADATVATILRDIVWGEPMAAVDGAGLALGIAVLPRSADAIDLELYRGDGAEDVVFAQAHALLAVDGASNPTDAPRDLARLRAALRPQSAPQIAHVVALFAAEDALLAELHLPADESMWLSPALSAALSTLCERLDGQAFAPLSLRALRAISHCPAQAFAHVRRHADGALDIAVCDAQGRVCLALDGLTGADPFDAAAAEAATATPVAPIVAPAATAVAQTVAPASAAAGSPVLSAPREPVLSAPREIALGVAVAGVASSAPGFGPVPPKPSNIALRPAADVPAGPLPSKARIALPALTATATTATTAGARLMDLGDGLFTLVLETAALDSAIDALMRAIAHVRSAADAHRARVLILDARDAGFWRGDRAVFDAAAAQGLYAALARLPIPTIAAVPGDADGAGLLLAATCDFLVLADDARLRVADVDAAWLPTAAEAAFLRERFGLAAEPLLAGGDGYRAQALGLRCRIVPAADVGAEARRIAADLGHAAPLALGLLKPHLARRLAPLAGALAPAPALPADALFSATDAAGRALRITLGDGRGHCDAQTLLADMKLLIAHAAASEEVACVVIASALESFLPSLGEAEAADLIVELDALLGTCPVPVIAVLGVQADGAAWRFALACDTVVYAQEGLYAASALWTTPALARSTAALCALRFDGDLGRELQLTLGACTGAELAARVPALRVAEGGETLAEAMRLAEFWGRWPRARVVEHIAAERARLAAAVAGLPEEAAAANEMRADARTAAVNSGDTVVALRTEAVTLTLRNDGVALIEMHDRAAKNMFSQALVEGLKQAFAYATTAPDCRAVVITGYDNYFATGGTLETLLAIQDGQAQFTDEKVFQLPMDCPLPTIAAIQGHGIGGGWSFGMFADAILLGEESRYLSPYMGYGFTPGAGSTLMFPARIGYDLARETLLTAQEISGHSLRQRAVPMAVLPRRDVLPAALALARRIARQPRARLVALKRLWTQTLRDVRDDAYAREVAMHAETFVDNAETLRTIQGKFRAQQPAAQAPVPQATADAATTSTATPATTPATTIATSTPAVSASAAATLSPAVIIDSIRTMLAQELFLKPEEIDDDTPFIDLGLDSITGVTWVRRINAEYGIEIEATKVYSHPTLQALGRLVIDAANAGRTAVAASARPAPSVSAPSVSAPVPPSATRPVAAMAASAPAVEDGARLRSVIDRIRTLLAAELHLQDDEIENGTPFIDMGLDSITGVTWVRRINAQFGTAIEATKVYSHPTLNEIGRLVLREAEQAGTVPPPVSPAVSPPVQAMPSQPVPPAAAHARTADSAGIVARARTPLVSRRRRGQGIARIDAPSAAPASVAGHASSATAAIAVIGVAGQFPDARDIDAYWANLAAGRNCIGEVDDGRWSLDEYFLPGAPVAGKTNSKWLGALDDYDRFDPLFFSISPTEAETMDPQQRLFLETCWHAIENAGYAPQSLSASQCGVFVGCGPSDYHQASQAQRLSAQGFTGAATSILAARIAYVLNLRGPCLSIDTACSSSLVAIAGACDSLNAGTSDLAIAGGVYVMGGPSMHVMTSQAGMLSTDGRCYTFDARANGFVPGEAVGAILLKRLADAERDGDRIQAVIEGWGINQDGKTNGITAPNEDAQMRLLQSVYRRFDIDPAGIQLIEAHGTGTKLGDPIEVAGLKAAFAPFTTQVGFCALGSVKSNIGHCLTAAGAAGVIKLVLALRERQLPPTIHYAQRNEHIRLEDSPFYVNDALQPWQPAAGARRRAAVSSFGFSGTNAHIVLAEHVQAAAPAVPDVLSQHGRLIVPLSARTEAQLREQAERLCAHLRARRAAGDDLRLADIAYTLQSGRDEMGERLCMLVDSTDALCAALEGFLAGRIDAATAFRGQVKRDRESLKLLLQDEDMRATVVGKWLRDGRLDRLADLWAKGLALDWSALYPGPVRPQRVALPGYPFARERHWLGADVDAAAIDCRPHPLLHENASLLSRQRYRTRLRGDEPVCRYRIEGVATLAPVALLEMARAAVADAAADQVADIVAGIAARTGAASEMEAATEAAIELADATWGAPVEVRHGVELWIELYALDEGANGADAICVEIRSGDDDAPLLHFSAIATVVAPEAQRLDLDALRARTSAEAFDAADVRAALAGAGLDIGAALCGATALRRGGNELLAELAVPVGDAGRYGLHPALLQGVLLAAARFIDGDAIATLSPIALSALTTGIGGRTASTAWVRHAVEADGGPGIDLLDIDLLDIDGMVCASLHGLQLGSIDASQALPAAVDTGAAAVEAVPEARIGFASPIWETLGALDEETNAVAGSRIVVMGADAAQRDALERHYRDAQLRFIAIDASDDIAAIAHALGSDAIDRMIWIAAAQPVVDLTEDSLIADQQRGILQALRIARALVSLGYETHGLRWDMVTLHSIPTHRGDAANPAHAGLQGFSGSLAEAYPHWKLRLVDVPALDAAALEGLDRLPLASRNACYAQRGTGWYRQQLLAAEIPADTVMPPPYREGGVYVVVGGAGGIGEAWTRHVVARHRARVVWIGRRAEDETVRARIAAIAELGPAPLYVQADAADPAQLRAAHARIRSEFPAIHGVVHSAVGAFDQSLKTVSEDDFRAILAAKIDLSVRIAQVFGGEPLDFALFFSSNASFVRGAGMSGYSAGCTFKDAYALRLRDLWPCPVKVVNWGYWSVGAGDALTDAMKSYFHDTGYRPLGADEAMDALDAFLASEFDQISITKTLRRADDGAGMRLIAHGRTGAPAPIEQLQALDFSGKFAGIAGKAGAEMEPLLCRLLGGIVASAGDVVPAYRRWCEESRKIVAAATGGARASGDTSLAALWSEWDTAMAAWQADAGRAALCTLVDACMRALPEILAGRRKPTDVIFPDSSLAFVERVYKTDTTSLAYNDSLSETLLTAVRAHLEHAPDAKIRFLEIGAGTGATTVGILRKLAPYAERIAEYCYTDLSKAFLFHAETHYAPDAPYLRTRLFNVEKPLIDQDIALGSYDFVIAANVIHATKHIRNTIRNTKALLRRDGLLLMNEVSDHSISGHVTFGLLDGWWLNEDKEVRIPGSPGLYPDCWREVLNTEGFHTVLFPCSEAHYAGQQIVAAFADGVSRQRYEANAPRMPAAAAAPASASPPKPAQAIPRTSPQTIPLAERTLKFCREIAGRALKIDADDIDASESLERYGIDSISISLINEELQKHFGDVGSTLLYEHQTIGGLANHLLATQTGRLQAMFAASAPARTAAFAASTPVRAKTAMPAAVVVPSAASLREQTVRFCKQLIGRALKIGADEIDATEPLERYGIDSIIVGLVNQELQKHFGDVGSTLLYEHQTIDGLARHLLDTQRDRLETMFAASAPARPAAQPIAPAAAPRAAVPVRARVAAAPPAPAAAVPARSALSLRDETIRFCKQLIGRALKIGADEIDATEPLERYGIDSIIVGLVNQELQKHFGDVGSTLLYEHQTIDGLAGHLLATQPARLEAMFAQTAAAVPAVDAQARTVAPQTPAHRQAHLPRAARRGRAAPAAQTRHVAGQRQPIAVVGLSGIYPDADDLHAFWENLKQGRNCIGEIPGKRWALDGFFEADENIAVEQGKSYCKWGGFLERFAEFDSLFFGIPPREALNMDPQERLFLQGAWSALENAGYTRRTLREDLRRRVGVFAGITRAGYSLYRNTADSEEKFWPRTSFASVANRLSYLLDIQGPSLPVDTMCSSSLTAIHEACEHIHNGDCDVAIAGGVNLYLHPTSFIDMSSQHMLSRDGVCKSFGEGANGFVPGEGMGVAILKSLDRAEADGDIIHGLILSTQVNHGGRTNGFTVPNPVAQAEVVRTAIDKAGISARAISYIEAHGTGTELGDPIEITGLQQAFGRDSADTGYCRIGSAKSNIGHLEAAAGIAGLTKVLLQLRHGQIAPTLHCERINPHIRFDRTAFAVNRELAPWERPVIDGRSVPRTAGISSFGAGGANAHVIVQEYLPAATRAAAHVRPAGEPALVPLSAKTSEQLRQKAAELRDALRADGGRVDLDAVAYTLQIGREAMEERALFLADSPAELIAQLDACARGDAPDARAYRGQAQRRKDGGGEAAAEALAEALRGRRFPELARAWIVGADVDWRRLYGATAPRRIELPTYPFARDEYWLDSVAPAAVQPAAAPRGGAAVARRDFGLIEDILGRIEASALDADQGARLLKKLV